MTAARAIRLREFLPTIKSALTAYGRTFFTRLISVERSSPPLWSDRERTSFHLCLVLSAVLYFACAFFCDGFHHADEYFQIIEFASSKLGLTPTADLPWEYHAQARSWIQPAIYVGLTKAAAAFGIDQPLTLMFLFRLFTGLISWASLWTLIVTGRRWIADEKDRRAVYLLAALLWLIPYLGVRTSGETLSSALLCAGIALLEWRGDQSSRAMRFTCAVMAGFTFGLCFEFRYPSVVMAAGAALFYLRASVGRGYLFAGLALGGIVALSFGAVIDFWGYGQPSFPFLSYFHANFVEGRAANYGTWPFYAYLFYPIATPMAPVVLFLTLATLIAWARRPGNVLVWATFPYFVALSLTAHKETRFLFPFAPFFPILIGFALAEYSPGSRVGAVVRWFTSSHRLRFLAIWNIAGLLVLMWLPATGDFPVYRLIEREVAAANAPLTTVVIHDPARRLYTAFGHDMGFIKPKSIVFVSNPPPGSLNDATAGGKPFLVVIDAPTPLPEQAAWVTGNCVLLNAPPEWYVFFDQRLRSKPKQRWELYRCGQGTAGAPGRT